jgi:hypothetical protein
MNAIGQVQKHGNWLHARADADEAVDETKAHVLAALTLFWENILAEYMSICECVGGEGYIEIGRKETRFRTECGEDAEWTRISYMGQ